MHAAQEREEVGWNKRVAEALAQAGHDVTVILVQTMEDAEKDVQFSKDVKVHALNASSGITRSDMEDFQKKAVFGKSQFRAKLRMSLTVTLQNKEFMQWLTDQKFDLAFVHMYHTCPIGLVHASKIPSWIWLNSGQLMDNVANAIGVPTPPSYVPREIVVNKETQIFREHWDPEFPDIMDLIKKCPLVMVNSNELYELPRPTLAKVINIGGIGVEYKDAKPLEGEFKKIAESGKGIVVMSFGSVAHAELMPEHWKTAFLKAFAHFPDYEIVIRYGSDDLKDRLPPNVHAHRWLPQADLLLHPNTKVFISHGGYNSLQESINSGVPLVTIALFGDQFKNSKIAAKHGFAVNLKKGTLDEASIVAALKEVLNNEK
ncbi:UDP-glucoronosyl and UDP-glucosyl transferase [Ancylostoma ceylanicum]|uniref:UDP-glucuronosyltransferase n=1 Tax=Ancylostoma ceylanicum TaxID=53326 RepID=A0A0D6LDK8_9BILA|nr:UDP-glucoronosyl and UDP-glucosyl transferase [Ancylostoma ceylanicum]